MKPIILILLFIFAVQKKINTDTRKDEPHKRGHTYKLIGPNCDSGYEKMCRPKRGIYIGNYKPSKECFCYEIKYFEMITKKYKKNFKDTKTTKDKIIKGEPIKDKVILDKTLKDKTSKDKTLKDFQITGKPVKVFENSPHCKNGENYVCYDMMTSRFFKRQFTQCRCSKTNY